MKTREFRNPKAGEWYLSGAIAEAYEAKGDLTSRYNIMRLVLTEVVTKTEIVQTF